MASSTGDTLKNWAHEILGKRDKNRTFKVLLIGDSVGKSSLILRFCANDFIDDARMKFIPMTLGLDGKTKSLEIEGPDGKEEEVHLNIWDTAGQERFRQLNEQYLPSVDAVILLYDVRNVHTFTGCRRFMDDVKKHCDSSVVRVLVGNKDDEDQSRKCVPTEHGNDFAKFNGYEFIETSAKDDKNVTQLFQKVAQLCRQRRYKEED